MRLVALHSALWFIPAVALGLALAPWPYAYYQLLRILVCATAGLIAVAEYNELQRFAGWALAFTVMAVVFNPLISIHLTRSIWAGLNVIGVAIFLIHWFAVRRVKGPE